MENNEDEKKEVSAYAKYTSVAFQMLATIGLFAFIGYKIDEHFVNENFICTALLGIVGVALSLYQVVKSLNKAK